MWLAFCQQRETFPSWDKFPRIKCYTAGKFFPAYLSVSKHIPTRTHFTVGKHLPIGKRFPYGKCFLSVKHFPVGQCFPGGKDSPVGMYSPNSQLRVHSTIWRNSSQMHQNQETFLEGNLLEFRETFTPDIKTQRKHYKNKEFSHC